VKYQIGLAKDNDLDGLCNIRNNRDLIMNYIQQHKMIIGEVYLIIAQQVAPVY
jgi:hypothetical protein